MKTRHTAIIFLAVLSIVTFGCDGDDCDGEEIMLPDGQVICIDTFSTNLAKKAILGDMLYHYEFGMITLTSKGWITKDKKIIKWDNLK